MAADVVTPLMQHALDVGQLFIDNACLKNGVTNTPQRYKVGQLAEPAPAATSNTSSQAAPRSPTAASSLAKWLGPAAIAAGGALAGIGVPWSLGLFGGNVTQPTTIINESAPKDGSLLQYLQDKGYHLPPEERK